MKKSTFLLLFSAFAVAFVATGCIKSDNDDTPPTYYYQDYFTISSVLGAGYILYSDNGVTVYPTTESVNSLTDNKGFENHKRAVLLLSYLESDVDKNTDIPTIHNAVLMQGAYMSESAPMTLAAATEKNINAEDSLFIVEKFSYYNQSDGSTMKPWAGSKQYLNVPCYAGYAYVNNQVVKPTFTIWYDDADLQTNKAVVTLGYNRHCKKDYSSVVYSEFLVSFPMNEILAKVPGNDSIDVTVMSKGRDPFTVRMGR